MGSRKESIRSFLMFKRLIRKLQLVLSLMASRGLSTTSDTDLLEETEAERFVPSDVKKGNFAVVARTGNGEAKRFVLELDYLSDPAFLRLMELAKREYGFQQKGVLVLPCQPEELLNILHNKQRKAIPVKWSNISHK